VFLAVTFLTVAGSVPATAKTPATRPRPAKKPGAPTNLVALPINGGTSVSWDAPVSDGGDPITGYIVTATPGTASCTTTGATACSVTGLANGHLHYVRVRASNAVGTGRAAGPVRVTIGQSQDCSNLANGANLQYCNLGHMDLSGISLVGANLTGAKLLYSNLDNADLDDAVMTGANLTDATLVGATLEDGTLNAYFIGVNLTDADLTGSNLDGADLASSNLTGADLGDATMQTATGTDSITWSDTTCPDETNSNNDGDTCLNDLTPQ
jgi:hypothetical protein